MDIEHTHTHADRQERERDRERGSIGTGISGGSMGGGPEWGDTKIRQT